MIGAEYVLRGLPAGTHDLAQFHCDRGTGGGAAGEQLPPCRHRRIALRPAARGLADHLAVNYLAMAEQTATPS
jgi:2-polyprenyl-3-methyl-5-hydroxy-6-metoxy-1,4-benzoquinol methylase